MMKLIATILLAALTAAIATAQPVIVAGGSASATVTISVVIPKSAKIESVEQQRQITVTAGDIRRGFKEISKAAALHVWSNSPGGYYLQHRIVRFIDPTGAEPTALLVLLTVAGTADPQPVGPEYQYIYQGHATATNREIVRIALKLMLTPEFKPGTYTLESDFTVASL
jgi:hypothetical protein